MTRRVAICQPKIILGGRLRVIVAIVELLNELGIVPDMVTSAFNFRPNEIAVHYDRDVALNWRMVTQRRLRGVHEEFYIWQFNRRLATISADYDLLIHTGNSLMFLPDHPASISYVFFPRKYRMNSPLRSIHLPDSKVKPLTRFGMQRTLQRAVMRRHPLATPHHVISMTHFTAAALRAVYPELGELPVVYPPVALPTGATLPPAQRDAMVVTMGRFARDKRQLDQIALAARLPELPFHMIGFVDDAAYFARCRRAVHEYKANNVTLHPNLLRSEAEALMRRSRYFLHTLINEPFGLTAVNAIALGCIPLVHDSGGQRETTPEPQLRYQALDHVPAMIERLEAQDSAETAALMHCLQTHVRANFSEAQFRAHMSAELAPYLVGGTA
ncbi:MAG: glycosyltransferase [Anaerolineae bacterium]|nr:glycosyltransferase [Anaerolineae bacterium]